MNFNIKEICNLVLQEIKVHMFEISIFSMHLSNNNVQI